MSADSISAKERGRIEGARRLLQGAERAMALTGAGVSAASGVPTFRGEEGMWKEHRPEELATPSAFRRDPRLVWEWYGWRREVVSGCGPNAAHLALARWSLESTGRRVVTQNVDGLHEVALRTVAAERAGDGDDAERDDANGEDAHLSVETNDTAVEKIPERASPIPLHGSVFRERCTGCELRRSSRDAIDASSRESLPRCPDCGSLLRPDVVWFGETLDPEALEAARTAAAEAEVCLVVGTSAVVQPAASLARVAARKGAPIVEVNPAATPLSRVAEVVFRAGAAEVLPELLSPGSR